VLTTTTATVAPTTSIEVSAHLREIAHHPVGWTGLVWGISGYDGGRAQTWTEHTGEVVGREGGVTVVAMRRLGRGASTVVLYAASHHDNNVTREEVPAKTRAAALAVVAALASVSAKTGIVATNISSGHDLVHRAWRAFKASK